MPRTLSAVHALLADEYKDDSLHASTRPLEALRVILSDAATVENDQTDVTQCTREVTVNDVSRLYFYALATRSLFMKLPPEDEEASDGEVGRLNVCLYGTRDAARGCQRTLLEHLVELGFVRGRGGKYSQPHRQSYRSRM